METTVIKSAADVYYIQHPGLSFAMFSVGEKGDLMINSDWGIFACAWRAYSGTFKEFLIGIDEHYFAGNIERQHGIFNRTRITKTRLEKVQELFKLLQVELRKELESSIQITALYGVPSIADMICTYETKEIRAEIEALVKNSSSALLPKKYTYDIINEEGREPVAKIKLRNDGQKL